MPVMQEPPVFLAARTKDGALTHKFQTFVQMSYMPGVWLPFVCATTVEQSDRDWADAKRVQGATAAKTVKYDVDYIGAHCDLWKEEGV